MEEKHTDWVASAESAVMGEKRENGRIPNVFIQSHGKLEATRWSFPLWRRGGEWGGESIVEEPAEADGGGGEGASGQGE